LVDVLGRLTSSWSGGLGTFSLASGEMVTIDLRDRIQRLMWGATYEPHVRKCFTAFLRPGDTFVDLGAHVGFFSVIAAALVGSSGKIFSFEANSWNFQSLYANATQFPWMTASHRAVSNMSGAATFSNPQQTGESGWGKLARFGEEGLVVTVGAVSLDDWHESVGSPPIRLIKIDAEGSEPLILESARRVIATARPYLILELNEALLCEVGRTRERVAKILRDQSYRIFTIGLQALAECRDSIDPLFDEILCVANERIEETMRLLPIVHAKH
jgi:FkbM family methyltransferase